MRPGTPVPLHVYLLPTVGVDAALRLQRRLAYDAADAIPAAGLVVCEHPRMVTMGRHASWSHLPFDVETRGWPVRWLGRGGGAWLHGPGQWAIYAVVPLGPLGLSLDEHLARLAGAFAQTFDDFSVRKQLRCDAAGVWVGARLAACVGVSMRGETATFGGVLNFAPDLDDYRGVQCHPSAPETMTSLERERRGPFRAALARERLLENVRERYGLATGDLFTDHPLLHAVPRPAHASCRADESQSAPR